MGRKKKSETGTGQHFTSVVKIADDVLEDARVVAALSGTTIADLISDAMRPILKKMLVAGLRERLESEGIASSDPKPKGHR